MNYDHKFVTAHNFNNCIYFNRNHDDIYKNCTIPKGYDTCEMLKVFFNL